MVRGKASENNRLAAALLLFSFPNVTCESRVKREWKCSAKELVSLTWASIYYKIKKK